MVAKANGTRRLVTDLRAINDVIIGQNVQLPPVHDLVEQVTQTRPHFLTSLDLFSGYFQTAVAPNSRHLLAFTSPQGERLAWAVAPFGLSLSPAHFINIVTHTLSRLLSSGNLYLYMDDVLISADETAGFEGHCAVIEQTL